MISIEYDRLKDGDLILLYKEMCGEKRFHIGVINKKSIIPSVKSWIEYDSGIRNLRWNNEGSYLQIQYPSTCEFFSLTTDEFMLHYNDCEL